MLTKCHDGHGSRYSPGTKRAGLFLAMLALFACSRPRDVQVGKSSPATLPVKGESPPTAAPKEMVWIAGGAFLMGSNHGNLNERPVHEASVGGFWMDVHEVTNGQFADFVRATHYVTLVEQKPKTADFPGVPAENLVAGALVFHSPAHPVSLKDYRQWWSYVPGANWRHPEGPSTSIRGKEKYPVVDVAYEDAEAYCRWAEKRLPTEAEWEFAAYGGGGHTTYVWGNEAKHQHEAVANIWQGRFPDLNTRQDGYYGTAPVASFHANGYGLYDMAGNVWEWTSDLYQPASDQQDPSTDPNQPPITPGSEQRVIKGGSYLCNDSYCSGFRPSARMASEAGAGQCHVGFRCVKPRSEIVTSADQSLTH